MVRNELNPRRRPSMRQLQRALQGNTAPSPHHQIVACLPLFPIGTVWCVAAEVTTQTGEPRPKTGDVNASGLGLYDGRKPQLQLLVSEVLESDIELDGRMEMATVWMG